MTENIKKYPVVIDKIGKTRDLPSGSKVVSLNITRLDNQDELKVDCFLGRDGELSASVGQELLMPLESKDYKGKPQYSTCAWKCEVMTPQAESKEAPEKDFTEREIPSKGNALLDLMLIFNTKKDMAKELLIAFNETCPDWYKQLGPASATFLEMAKMLLQEKR